MEFSAIKELDARNYMTVFNRQNLCFTRGEGCKLYDTTGKEYTDFVAGIAVNVLGHRHPALTAAIKAQADTFLHVSNLYYIQEQAEMCEKLLDGTIFDRVFLCNSGAEANEGALKLVRKYYYNRGENKPKILSALHSFHGRTLATATLTGQDKYSAPFAPLPEGIVHIPYNDFNAFKAAVDDTVGAVFLEPIQGESGVVPADYEYLINVYAYCRTKGILLVVDEVQTGMGRTGRFFGFENYGIQPDIVTMAKGLAGGVPIGAVLARGEAAEAFRPGDHGSTFGGNPLACAAASAVLGVVKNEDFLRDVREKGARLKDGLAPLKKHTFVRDIRGTGLMVGLELAPELPGAQVVGKMASAGFLLNCAGRNTLRFVPPLVISEAEIDDMCATLAEIFAKTNI